MNQRAGNHQPTLHAAGKNSCLFESAVPEFEFTEIFLGTLHCDLAAYPIIAGLIHNDIQYGVEQIQIDFLWNEPNAGLRGFEFTIDIVSEDLDLSCRLADQRTDNSDSCSLARTVGAEERIEVAGLDIEVDSLQRLIAVRVSLGKFFDRQCSHRVAYCIRGDHHRVGQSIHRSGLSNPDGRKADVAGWAAQRLSCEPVRPK